MMQQDKTFSSLVKPVIYNTWFEPSQFTITHFPVNGDKDKHKNLPASQPKTV
jgi:hypothetical protein